MPIYEYKCSECGHEFELIQKISEKPKRKCEKCGRLKAKRVISQTSFVLKGSGWYATDYGNRRNPPRESEPITPPSSSSEKKSDKKSDKKKEVKKAS